MLQSLTPVSVLKAQATQILETLNETGEPVVITKNGVAKGVLVTVDEYTSTGKTLAMLRMMATSKQDIAEGRYRPADDVIADQRTRVRAARNAKK